MINFHLNKNDPLRQTQNHIICEWITTCERKYRAHFLKRFLKSWEQHNCICGEDAINKIVHIYVYV
jgi:hypothetical protein